MTIDRAIALPELLPIIDTMRSSAELLSHSESVFDRREGVALAKAAERLSAIAAHSSESQRVVGWSAEFTEKVREALVFACVNSDMDKWRPVLAQFDSYKHPPAADLVSDAVDTNTVVSTETDNPRHKAEPAPRVDGEAVAWQFKDSEWLEWASITREQYDAYRSGSHTGSGNSFEIRALYTHPEPREVTDEPDNNALARALMRLSSPDQDAILKALGNAYRSKHPQPSAPVDDWISVNDRLPEEEVMVVVYWRNENGRGHYNFDAVSDGRWTEHHNCREHFEIVGGVNAAGEGSECVGPPQEAPYTHWKSLKPPALATQRAEGET